MPYKYLLLLIMPAVLFSCKKEKDTTDPQPPPPRVPAGLLKDIIIPHLPSPFYHFEYDTVGTPVVATYASGLYNYNLVYSGDRLTEMRDNIFGNKDRLQYFYDDAEKVNAVSYVDSRGGVYKKAFFVYDGQQLIQAKWERKSAAGFERERTLTMRYYADGNLEEITDHRDERFGQPEAEWTDRYEEYDNKVNTDGFSLIHVDFFDHLLLLPGVQLQKNNPGKVTHTGDGTNYKVDYSYTYNEHDEPMTKIGDAIFLSGPDTGKKFQTSAFYSYY